MVVAQLEVRSLPIPEVPSSNPVVGKIYIEHLFTVNCIEKTKIKKKRPRMAHIFLKKAINNCNLLITFETLFCLYRALPHSTNG